VGAGAADETVEMDEMVEWVDADDSVVAVVSRARMRRENLRHRSVAVIVTTTDGRLVVQRRSEHKDLFPGWWDIGAGGVVAAGEDRLDAARRELAEELGIAAELTFRGVGRHDDANSREICHVYSAVHDGPFHADDGEVVEIRALDGDGFAALSEHEPILPGSVALLLPYVPGFRAAPSWQRAAPPGLPCTAVQRVEFTIEPFVEARPGPHVTEPVAALTSLGVEVDVGPFGSACEVANEDVANVVATVVRVAVDHGATHVNVDVTAVDAP
jgi:8-oxo-dGTP pyrophosphatase MutT (NUDIX family)